MMEVLNVAGDDRAAKTIASYLSGGSLKERNGLSKKNKIYEFETEMNGERSKMIMTSVSEHHLMNYMFRYNKWSDDERKLLALFSTPIDKLYDTRFTGIKRTLEREVKSCQALIIWTYCDPEGENTAFEIVNICQALKSNIKIYRARFTAITPKSVRQALNDLGKLNKTISDSVDVRRQLDLRIGVAFTRFQRMRLERKFWQLDLGAKVNYGSCLLPTLGFAVERYLDVKKFEKKSFWTIKVTDIQDEMSVEFKWEKNHSLEELPCQIILDKYRSSSTAIVEKINCDTRAKERPMPLNTVELAKHCSDLFNLTVKEVMDIALDLYNKGFISYPYTETNQFADDLDLESLIQSQIANTEWGIFAQQILKDGPSPRQGMKSDGAHPPIYPKENINDTWKGNEAVVYEFIVRRFLACLSKDAEIEETFVKFKVSDEQFEASGLRVIAKNYLDVYPYENFNDIKIHEYKEGQTFSPIIEVVKGETSPPNLLTESDLITLKQEQRIGTDSTYADHIESIKVKDHVRLINGKYLEPTNLGLAMVMGYSSIESGKDIVKPDLRKRIDNDLKLICDGIKSPAIVLRHHLDVHRAILTEIFKHSSLFDATVAEYLKEEALRRSRDFDTQIIRFKLQIDGCKGEGAKKKKKEKNGS